MMDLWNSGIPTLEEYSQSVSKQMYYFNRDLLAEPQDQVDPLPASILLYRFHPAASSRSRCPLCHRGRHLVGSLDRTRHD